MTEIMTDVQVSATELMERLDAVKLEETITAELEKNDENRGKENNPERIDGKNPWKKLNNNGMRPIQNMPCVHLSSLGKDKIVG